MDLTILFILNATMIYSLLGFAILSIIMYLIFKRNYFNKYKYVRLVKYNDDMSINVQYIKKDKFNQDNSILINDKHVFNFNGYTSIIITSNSQESINPIDFNSKYDAKKYKDAIKSKLIHDTFASLKVDKFDKLMGLLLLNILQLIAIAYLIYNLLGKGV